MTLVITYGSGLIFVKPTRMATKSSGQYGITVDGVDDVMLRLAKCCRPVPGDEIVGYISLGRGITIHRQDCPNTFDDRVPAERKVMVEWDARVGETFPVRLVVYGHDRTSLLAEKKDLANKILSFT